MTDPLVEHQTPIQSQQTLPAKNETDYLYLPREEALCRVIYFLWQGVWGPKGHCCNSGFSITPFLPHEEPSVPDVAWARRQDECGGMTWRVPDQCLMERALCYCVWYRQDASLSTQARRVVYAQTNQTLS